MLRFRIITFFKLIWQTCSQSVERVKLSGIKPKEWAERCCKAQDEWGIAWSGNSHLIHCSYRNIDYSSFKYHPPPQIKWFFKTFNIWSYHLVYVRHHKELLHYPLLASLLQSSFHFRIFKTAAWRHATSRRYQTLRTPQIWSGVCKLYKKLLTEFPNHQGWFY